MSHFGSVTRFFRHILSTVADELDRMGGLTTCNRSLQLGEVRCTMPNKIYAQRMHLKALRQIGRTRMRRQLKPTLPNPAFPGARGISSTELQSPFVELSFRNVDAKCITKFFTSLDSMMHLSRALFKALKQSQRPSESLIYRCSPNPILISSTTAAMPIRMFPSLRLFPYK